MISTDQFASLVVVAVGLLLLWANPKRKINRAVFFSSAVVAAWLAFNHLASSGKRDGLFWLRLVFASGALAPLSLWVVKESIVGGFRFRDPRWVRKNSVWFISAAVLLVLPFLEVFIPSHSTSEERVRGIAYYCYYVIIVGLYGFLLWESLRSLKTLSGARKLELQVWLCGGCITAVVIYTMIALGGPGDPIFRHLKPVAILVFYAGTAYAITSHRIFDARQILLVGSEKVTLILLATLLALLVNQVVGVFLGETPTLIITAAVIASTAGSVNNWLDRKFQFVSQAGPVRQAAFATAQKTTRLDSLESSFCALLKGWGQSEEAMILSSTKGRFAGTGIEVEADEALVSAMKTLHWATPERLMRERQTAERRRLADLLTAHNLGALVFEEGATLKVIVGVGVGASRRPYTYPQIVQLVELASIIQGAFERAHFSTKAQQAEQLATAGLLGASVAHEIRNPLVSIKTFVQLLPTHYKDQAFRDKFFKLIGDEVDRIDQLTEQLLDLASPRAYSAQLIELHPLLSSSLDLVAAKAAHRRVQIITDFKANPDRAFTDASAAKQVVLNLCFNALQAVENHSSEERWVKVTTNNTALGLEMCIADSGPGISAAMRARLFQPFQTTKSSGFGLGLAVCSDILGNLNASISVDPPVPGRGASFRVIFPCQPLSS